VDGRLPSELPAAQVKGRLAPGAVIGGRILQLPNSLCSKHATLSQCAEQLQVFALNKICHCCSKLGSTALAEAYIPARK
jgi:hypothetical protein